MVRCIWMKRDLFWNSLLFLLSQSLFSDPLLGTCLTFTVSGLQAFSYKCHSGWKHDLPVRGFSNSHAYTSPGDPLKWRFWFIRFRMEPQRQHFYRAPRRHHHHWSKHQTLNSGALVHRFMLGLRMFPRIHVHPGMKHVTLSGIRLWRCNQVKMSRFAFSRNTESIFIFLSYLCLSLEREKRLINVIVIRWLCELAGAKSAGEPTWLASQGRVEIAVLSQKPLSSWENISLSS